MDNGESEAEMFRLDLDALAHTFHERRAEIGKTLSMVQGWQRDLLRIVITRNQDFDASIGKHDLCVAFALLQDMRLPEMHGFLDTNFVDVIKVAAEYDLYGPDTYRTRGYMTTVTHFLTAFSACQIALAIAWRVGSGKADVRHPDCKVLRMLYNLSR